MKRFRILVLAILLVCICQLVAPEALWACPTCKDGLHADGTAAAYAISILLMMGMPFTIFAGWVTVIWRLRAAAASV